MRLLDLYCGEGGASMGYHRAGFEVVGVDNVNHAKRYPFPFVKADALDYLREHGHEYDAIHASPPCQAYSIGTPPEKRALHPDLLAPTRAALREVGKPYVIENVPRAPMYKPIMLCGSMFDLLAFDKYGILLALRKHRLFESNYRLFPPGPCRHDKNIAVGGVYGGGRDDRGEAHYDRRGGYSPAKHAREGLMGIDWMSMKGLSQAIPPVYTQYLGDQLLAVVEAVA